MATPDTKRRGDNTMKIIRRFSSIKVNFEKEKEETISRFQEENLRRAFAPAKCFNDKQKIHNKLQELIACYKLPELYINVIVSALLPAMESRNDSNEFIQHLKHVFKIDEKEHAQLVDIARAKNLPKRMINLQVMEAKNIPVTDTNGLSDPFCVVYVTTRDTAQKTDVIHNTLNPVWKEKFSLKVNDLKGDALVLEVMDHNQKETFKEKIKRIKEVRSAKTFRILMKELLNSRSPEEIIGSLRIPISEIRSETIESWYDLKYINKSVHKNRGKIYLRMILGYNKPIETATVEFLEILYFLLVNELDNDSSLDNPFYWDDKFKLWSQYTLRQFKWQGGLKPKDVVLTKWRAYAKVNEIFPLKASMLRLLLKAVLERVRSGEYDSPNEMSIFWESANTFVSTVANFVTDIHDLFSCTDTISNVPYMLKSVGLICSFLRGAQANPDKHASLTASDIIDRISSALRVGANNFSAKAHNATYYVDENEVQVELEKLVQVGQILHEDLRLGLCVFHNDMKRILNIDSFRITYEVYDEQFGEKVKNIVEKYNSMIQDQANSYLNDSTMEDNSPAVKTGLTVQKLYYAVKSLAELAPVDYLKENVSEFSLKSGFYDWFFPSVDKWICILRGRIIKWLKDSINIEATCQTVSSDTKDSKWTLSNTDNQYTKDIPIGCSAVDTAQMFRGILHFWNDLSWCNGPQANTIVTKLLKEVYNYLSYYAAQIFDTATLYEPKTNEIGDEAAVYSYIYKVCRAVNDINYMMKQVELLVQELHTPEIIEGIRILNLNSNTDDCDCEAITGKRKCDVLGRVCNVTQELINNSLKVVLYKYLDILQNIVSAETCRTMSRKQNRYSRNRCRVINFVGDCLFKFKDNLDYENYQNLRVNFWIQAVDGIEQKLRSGIEMGKSSRCFFQAYNNLLHQLRTSFWSNELELKLRDANPDAFIQHDLLAKRLSYLETPLEQLKIQYYKSRFKRQQSTPVARSEHGALTIRACLVEKEEVIIVEVLNARNLRAYDSDGHSDPYVVVTLKPKDTYKTCTEFTTKWYRKTLFPRFDETFRLKIRKEEMHRDGFLMLTLYDYDYFNYDDFMGEAMLPVKDLTKLEESHSFDSLEQIHLSLSKPVKSDEEMLVKFSERRWQKEALNFARNERYKIEKKEK
ncbi:unnamed protein product [Orchesella dallaii]|uniref:Protein unc-13 D n=1 Tax=Orchesella dallaii TaxID=48710 RepID=A0ABP1PUT5_9HEXA